MYYKMADLALKIQNFEGPLDLLMHLIEKDKIDIYNIPIVEITEQYIAYLSSMQDFDMEIASEFLVMAATLLQIKSRMLLPKREDEEAEEESDPRTMLVEMLIEYRKIKSCAEKLQQLKETASRYVTRTPMDFGKNRRLGAYSVSALVESMLSLLAVQESNTAYIERQEFSVQEKMTEIVKLLGTRLNGVEFREVFRKTGSRSEKVAGFLALLELLKLNIITINQSEPYAPIYIFLRQKEESYVS